MSGAADGELQRKIEEYRSRERVYLAGLMGQESEMSHLRQMAADVLNAYGDVSRAAARGALTSPAANMEVLILRQKLREKEQQITQLREELEANRFDQHVPAGKALMKKCKALLTENKELGELWEEIREGREEERVAELRAAMRAEQAQNSQLYQKVHEASDFCKELSEENEKLQGTIAKVAGRLRESRAELESLVKERAEAKKKRKIERESKAAIRAASAAGPGGAREEAADGGATSVLAALARPPPAALPPAVFQVFEMPPPAAQPAAAVAQSAGDGGAQKAKEKTKKEKKDKSKKRKAERGTADGAEDADGS